MEPLPKVCITYMLYIFTIKFSKSWPRNFQTFQSGMTLDELDSSLLDNNQILVMVPGQYVTNFLS